MTVGERIRERRKELGLTQEELGKRMGYKKATVCRVELEDNNITTDRVVKFAKALDTTPGYLMGWENTDTYVIQDKDDETLLSLFHVFNSDGKRRILEYAKDLAKINSYRRDR